MVTNFLQPFQHFSEWLSAFEQRLFKPANVIRFLVVLSSLALIP
ncbi:MAG: hypothetical protein ACODUE_08680 [Synechococcus sp.]